MDNVGLINHSHQHTHAGTQDVVNLTTGVVVRITDKESRERGRLGMFLKRLGIVT